MNFLLDDDLDALTRLNKASLVTLFEGRLIERDVAARAAAAIRAVAQTQQPERAVLTDYLDYEKQLATYCGEDASKLHLGRSRVDINRTRHRLRQRAALLAVGGELEAVREALLELSNQGRHALVPSYTLGVQAQPTSFGHYLSAFAAMLSRSADHLKFVYSSLNQSPFGTGAGNTSTFPIDRTRLSDLLGFDKPIVNSFDAVHLSPLDSGLDLVHLARSLALSINLFLTDHAAQYRSGMIWLEVDRADVGISSLMPHKRNPDPVNALRRDVAAVLGLCSIFDFLSHNVSPGTTDYAGSDPFEILERASLLLGQFRNLLITVRFDSSIALQVVRTAGGSSTELMNVLVRRAGMPPRLAHDFVSDLIDHFKGDPEAFHTRSFSFACKLLADQAFPLSEQEYYQALDPCTIVYAATGLGGSQPVEVDRMHVEAANQIAADRAWKLLRIGELESANDRLEQAFHKIAKAGALS